MRQYVANEQLKLAASDIPSHSITLSFQTTFNSILGSVLTASILQVMNKMCTFPQPRDRCTHEPATGVKLDPPSADKSNTAASVLFGK
jgi:hypothetical protein